MHKNIYVDGIAMCRKRWLYIYSLAPLYVRGSTEVGHRPMLLHAVLLLLLLLLDGKGGYEEGAHKDGHSVKLALMR